MKTVSDIITSFGGVGAFAKFFGFPRATVNTWRRRNYLPPERDVEIITEAKRRALPLTYEHLAKIRDTQNAA